MFSVGVDMVEIARIEKSLKQKGFFQRVFGTAEQDLLLQRGYPDSHRALETAAASFCAKEAFAKAIKTGIRGFSLSEVELLRDSSGAPYLSLSGRAKVLAEGYTFSVSISHTREYAIATVLAVKE